MGFQNSSQNEDHCNTLYIFFFVIKHLNGSFSVIFSFKINKLIIRTIDKPKKYKKIQITLFIRSAQQLAGGKNFTADS